MTRLIRLFGFLLLLVPVSFAQSGRDQLLNTPFRAGVTHVDGKYGFTQDNFLLEGSRRISDFGSDAIFIYMEPQFRSRYPDKTAAPFWPAGELESITELAKTAPYKAVFDLPFKTFVITAYAFATQGDVQNFATDPGLAALEEQEFYDLTRYLLTTYAGTGKTFILKHWEGDYVGLRGFDTSKDISPGMVDAMNIWLSARQRGISRARTDAGNPSGVGVFHAVEVSRVLDYSRSGLTRVINAVIPVVKPDMVAYSSYDSTLGGSDAASASATINEALNVIKSLAPDPLNLGNKRILISEYGLFENERSADEVAWRTGAILQTAQAAGVFGAFFWQVFDNECKQSDGTYFPTDSSPGDPLRPTNSQCRGVWLVKPDGQPSLAKPVVEPYWRPSTSGSTITGRITSAASGSGIAGAKVSFYGGETTADGAGNYQLRNVPSGNTQLTAGASGYQNYSVIVNAGSQNTANFALIPSTAAGSVTGRVTSAIDGSARPGVTVSYSGGSTTTDSTGAFQFAAIPGGTYSFTTQLTGWVPVTLKATVQPAVASVLNLRIATGAKLTGRVTNNAGSPLAGASVNVHGGLVPTNVTVSTDSNGYYDSGWVAIGSYQATASASNYASSSASVTLTTGVVSTHNFVLGSGPPDFTLTVSPASQTVTAGQATTYTVQVTPAQGFSSTVSLSATGLPTGASASFSPASVASGSSTLTVNTSAGTPAGTYTVTVNGTGGALQHSTQVSLVVKSAVPTGSITGRITSAIDGAALSGATVSYSGGSTTSDANGYYTFKAVAPGTYPVTAQKSGWVTNSTTVTVGSGTATANIKLATGGKIAGKVVNRSGVPISGATIKMTGGLVSTSVTVTTSSTGVYTSPWIAIGNYTVQASKTGYTTQSKTTTVSTGATATVNFTMQ